MTARTILRTVRAEREDIADLVTRRPGFALDEVDPFLLINHHGPQVYPPGNRGLPFGPHPHRGFETVTFIVEGSLVHRDTAGHESEIVRGGVQWMTAGRGVEHSETSSTDFRDRGGPLEILQLWINLPSRLKMTEPRYIGLPYDAIPHIVAADGVTLDLISGTFAGERGPVEPLTDVFLATVEMKSGSRVALPAPRGTTVFLYDVTSFELIEFNDDGDTIALEAPRERRVIFGCATPYGEPIAAQGPFVMNTRAEILAAIRDYQEGRFRGKVAI